MKRPPEKKKTKKKEKAEEKVLFEKTLKSFAAFHDALLLN